ncbi:ABC transporter substrate-binding protein [Microbacterium indicum]|uniref:ABC transporter substrate-binding protein n=1 Tax=Microbacterium indicum TaxID=358100 RepID=UPI0003FEC096|nr:sugar ABC transporter substrate-binding protein [Microbacterium indicum]
MALTRRTFLSAAAVAALAALAGCASRLEPIDTSSSAFGSGEASGTINFWCRADTLTANQALVDAFHASQDRIHIELTPVPNGQYVTKLATAIRGNRPPDLVDIDDIYSSLFAQRGVLADLTPLVEKLPYADVLSPGHLSLAAKDGRSFGVPFLADNSLMWCNLELFDRAGLDVDEATGSFEGYLDAARALGGLGDGTKAWWYPGNSSGFLGFVVQPHMWADDADLIQGEIGSQTGFVVGNEPARKTLEFLHTLWNEDLVPTRCFSDDGAFGPLEFMEGTAGMAACSIGNLSNAEDGFLDRVESRMMVGPEGGRSFFDGGDNFVIPNGAQNAEAAWEYVLFCLDTAQQAELPASGYTPIRSDVLTDDFRRRWPHSVTPLEQIDAGYAPLSLSYNRIYNQSDGPWLEMFRRAVFDGEIDAAMQAAQSTYDQILRQGDA